MRLVPGALCSIRQSGSPEPRITITQFTVICFCALLISGCVGSDADVTSAPARGAQEVADLGSLGSLQGLARSYAGMTSDAVKQSLIAQSPVATTIDGRHFEACANQEAEGMFTLVQLDF
jgi:hypothetical protein